jgi:DNA-binding protein HU-beta
LPGVLLSLDILLNLWACGLELWESIKTAKDLSMNKDELATAVAAKTGFTKRAAEDAVNAVFETIMDIVRDGDRVTIAGFGTFALIERAARKGRNPKTGKMIEIPARKAARFSPGKTLRELAK